MLVDSLAVVLVVAMVEQTVAKSAATKVFSRAEMLVGSSDDAMVV